MKKISKLLLVLLASSVVLVSCSNDDDSNDNVSLGNYDHGFFVVNEGTSTTATITFVSNSGAVEQDIFRNVNPTAPATGTYLQSMFFDDTRAFIISGLANQITVVNRYTFQYLATISTNIQNPRYGVVLNGKAYVTNSGDFESNTDDFLTVINLADNSTTKVNLNKVSEKILEENGKLYISNGSFSGDETVTVFNPATNTSEQVINLGFVPNSFDEENNTLYVMGSAKIGKVNLTTNQLTSTITLPETQIEAKNLTIEDNKIYYTVNTSVYVMALNATSAPTTPLLTYTSGSLYGGMYGFAVNDGKIYVAEGGNFASDSQIFVYSQTGNLEKTVSVGVGPNNFYFND